MLDPGPELAHNHVHLSDPNGPKSDSYDSWRVMSYDARARKTAQNYENYGNWNGGGLRFGVGTDMEDESGVCSPPLWKTSPSTSPNSGNSPLHGQHHQSHYRYLSPASRTQAIARGRRELMEMVRNMPESSYELSLKDLVEHQTTMEGLQETRPEERNCSNEIINQKKGKRKDGKKVQVVRTESFDNGGFLLKMVFPISFGSKKKKKKKNSVMNTCSKVSPKPPASDVSSKGIEKEWWKKKFSVTGESENGGSRRSRGSSSSSSSNSSSSRYRSGFFPGCCSIFHTKKSKTAEKKSWFF